jgi:hypothetical protein
MVIKWRAARREGIATQTQDSATWNAGV